MATLLFGRAAGTMVASVAAQIVVATINEYGGNSEGGPGKCCGCYNGQVQFTTRNSIHALAYSCNHILEFPSEDAHFCLYVCVYSKYADVCMLQ